MFNLFALTASDLKSLCLCISVSPQMDALCNGVKKPEGTDPTVDPRPPPAKLARLEQNGAGPSGQEQGGQLSPVAKNPCVGQKAATVRPQSRSLHSRGRQQVFQEISVSQEFKSQVAFAFAGKTWIQGACCPCSVWWSTRKTLWRERR